MTGEIAKPKIDEPKAALWETWNTMIMSWITNTLDENLQGIVAFRDIAKEMWDDLMELYSQKNGPRVHQIKNEIAFLRQDGLTASTYFTKLKALWDELGTYSKVSNCTCGAAAEIMKELQYEKVHKFLMGLDSSLYGTIRSQILNYEPLPTLGKAYSMVVAEERHQMVSCNQEHRAENAAAFYSGNGGRHSGKFGGQGKGNNKDRPT